MAREILQVGLKLRTLRCENYPELPGWAQSSHSSPEKRKRMEERRVRKMPIEKDLMSNFEDGRRGSGM